MTPLEVGMRASLSKVFSDEEVRTFAALSGDANAIHLDDQAAAESPFGRRVVHGMLVSSLFSAVLGQELPGAGTVYLAQNLKFRQPVFLDEEVKAEVEVLTVRTDKPIATIRTVCRNAGGDVVIEGEAVVLFPAARMPELPQL